MTRRGSRWSGVGRRGAVVAVVSAVVAGLLALGGCAGSVPDRGGASTAPHPNLALPVGSSVHTLAVGGRTRSFRVYRPVSLPAGARVPLVVMIHGGGGSARGAETRYGWNPEADRGRFLVAYPEGVRQSWNGGQGQCCGPAGHADIDDVGFLTAMVHTIEQAAPVDPQRVYATGISEGGIMSYRLACSTRLFAAIAPDSATLLGPCPNPPPVSVLHLHGNADTRIPFDGHPGIGVNHITGGPITDLVARWRTVDRCAPPSTSTRGPVHTTTATCPDGRTVTLVEIDGAGHQWPGSAPSRTDRQRRIPVDPPSTALDATDTIWTFFAAHPGH